MNSQNKTCTIFLDIDGVLYPTRKRKAFLQDAKQIRLQYAHLNLDKIDDYRLLCVYEGWDMNAITYLKDVILNNDCKIIVSSSWKFKYTYNTLKTLFLLHDINISGIVDNTYSILKSKAIPLYLKEHPEIKNYLVLDDAMMRTTFKNHFVYCPDVINEEVYKKIKKYLKKFNF